MYYRALFVGSDTFSEYFSDKDILKKEIDKLLRCSACPTFSRLVILASKEKGKDENPVSYRIYQPFEYQSVSKEYIKEYGTEDEILKKYIGGLYNVTGFYTKWYTLPKD